ncbi:hypothetical protein D3M73_02805 [Rodentibacter pneumotropicus]|nr:hypothetical protein D3M73_02805 [Rodentibacter pneumotropicus]
MREIPIIRAVESSKLVLNRAELFPCGVVFLSLSTIDLYCCFCIKTVGKRKEITNFGYKKITLTG